MLKEGFSSQGKVVVFSNCEGIIWGDSAVVWAFIFAEAVVIVTINWAVKAFNNICNLLEVSFY